MHVVVGVEGKCTERGGIAVTRIDASVGGGYRSGRGGHMSYGL